MRIAFYYLWVFFCTYQPVKAQPGETYKIFTREGKEVHFEKMMRSLSKVDVVFFGELHNDPIGHWLELQALKELYANHQDMTLAMEMFEADDQIILNEYLTGTIQEKHFLDESKAWNNYKTDYKPLIEFAREHKLKVVASNIPRRYANLVYRKGLPPLDSLSDDAKQWMAPLPIDIDLNLQGYKSMTTNVNNHAGGGSDNMVMAQAVKDATMAYFIAKSKTQSNKIYHINGYYHSQDGEGIIWNLKKYSPSLEIGTIHLVEQQDISSLDIANKNKADFIICVPSDMIKTY